MPPAGFQPTIPACEQPQIHALDSVPTAIGVNNNNDGGGGGGDDDDDDDSSP
jgi:hypothetical protein